MTTVNVTESISEIPLSEIVYGSYFKKTNGYDNESIYVLIDLPTFFNNMLELAADESATNSVFHPSRFMSLTDMSEHDKVEGLEHRLYGRDGVMVALNISTGELLIMESEELVCPINNLNVRYSIA